MFCIAPSVTRVKNNRSCCKLVHGFSYLEMAIFITMSPCEKHVRRTCTLRRFNEAHGLDLYFNNRINGGCIAEEWTSYTRAERRRTALKRSTIGLTWRIEG